MSKSKARLLIKSVAFLTLIAACAVAALKVHESSLNPRSWETDSVLLAMPRDSHRDVVLLGSGRAQVFSRYKDHEAATEAALGRSVLTLATPGDGGLRPARFYLETYFDSGNTAKHVVYFFDPFALYSDEANDADEFSAYEPFHLRTLAKMNYNGHGYGAMLKYFRTKFSRAWLFQKPVPLYRKTDELTSGFVTPERIQQRLESLYKGGMPQEASYVHYMEFARIVSACHDNGAILTVAVAPTLLSPEPAHYSVLEMLHSVEKMGGSEIRDWVNAIPDPAMYSDLDHLNFKGVEEFMGKFVRPLLDSVDAHVLESNS